jgi:hypothetical protein
MEAIFENSKICNVRNYTVTNLVSDETYNRKNKYKFEILIRHPERTNAEDIFNTALACINNPRETEKVEQKQELKRIFDRLVAFREEAELSEQDREIIIDIETDLLNQIRK